MKVVRWTVYVTAPFMLDHQPPMHVVVLGDALAMPPEEVGVPSGQDALVISDIFEMPDAELEEAIPVAMARAQAREEIEGNMATLYFWNAVMLRRVRQGGVLLNPAPAPIPSNDIATVCRRLAEHPAYNRQTISTTSAIDGVTVVVNDGVVSTGPDKETEVHG
jgi:hypothetical protein